MSKMLLARISKVLSYNPKTGLFRWKIYTHSCHGLIVPGTIAGTSSNNGRIQIKVAGKLYRAHRLAFLFMTGKMPPKGKDVDHRDGVDSNNKWKNLRLATRGQNNWNNHNIRSDNKSGKVGVSWSIQGKGWTARVTVNKKIIHLGYFKNDLQAAIKVRRAAELKYFGEYAPK